MNMTDGLICRSIQDKDKLLFSYIIIEASGIYGDNASRLSCGELYKLREISFYP